MRKGIEYMYKSEMINDPDSPQHGSEIMDPNPVAIPISLSKPPTLQELIKRIVKADRMLREQDEFETFDEADDFDISDDPADPKTQYEENFDKRTGEILETLDTERSNFIEEKPRGLQKASPKDAAAEPEAKK